jgi:hypothetical protein
MTIVELARQASLDAEPLSLQGRAPAFAQIGQIGFPSKKEIWGFDSIADYRA